MNDVDAQGNCSKCGGVHYGTGPVCVFSKDYKSAPPWPKKKNPQPECHTEAELQERIAAAIIKCEKEIRADLSRIGPNCNHPARCFSNISSNPTENVCDVCVAVAAFKEQAKDAILSWVAAGKQVDQPDVQIAIAAKIDSLLAGDSALAAHDERLLEPFRKLLGEWRDALATPDTPALTGVSASATLEACAAELARLLLAGGLRKR